MTTPKEALRPFAACIFNDNGDITIDTSHLRTEDYMRAKSALVSLQGEDAVERVAEAIRQWTSHSYMQLHAGEMTARERRTVTAVVEAIERQVRAILATGLVPDEAAVRADQRPLGDVFNELVRRMNFDGMDPRTFTLGELERAIDGARFPK